MVNKALNVDLSLVAGSQIIETEFATEEKFDELSTDSISRTNSFLTIRRVAINFDLLRSSLHPGAEISRPAVQVLEEAGNL